MTEHEKDDAIAILLTNLISQLKGTLTFDDYPVWHLATGHQGLWHSSETAKSFSALFHSITLNPSLRDLIKEYAFDAGVVFAVVGEVAYGIWISNDHPLRPRSALYWLWVKPTLTQDERATALALLTDPNFNNNHYVNIT